jgi:hypothetical protein
MMKNLNTTTTKNVFLRSFDCYLFIVFTRKRPLDGLGLIAILPLILLIFAFVRHCKVLQGDVDSCDIVVFSSDKPLRRWAPELSYAKRKKDHMRFVGLRGAKLVRM